MSEPISTWLRGVSIVAPLLLACHGIARMALWLTEGRWHYLNNHEMAGTHIGAVMVLTLIVFVPWIVGEEIGG